MRDCYALEEHQAEYRLRCDDKVPWLANKWPRYLQSRAALIIPRGRIRATAAGSRGGWNNAMR